MAHPIHLCDARVVQYLRLFSGQFSLPQWKYFVTVLLGLVHCDERHTLSALLRRVAGQVTIFGLCFFLRTAPWSIDDLTAVRQAHFVGAPNRWDSSWTAACVAVQLRRNTAWHPITLAR